MTTMPRAMGRWVTFVSTSGPEGEGWILPRFAAAPWEKFLPEAWGISDETDLGWTLVRLRPTPFGRFKDAVRRRNLLAETLPRTYIRCLRWPHPGFDRYADAARRTQGWRCYELDSRHFPYVTHPGDLVEPLLKICP
jgi:hypothetical protein